MALLTWYAWRHRSVPGALAFTWLVAAITEWSIASTIALEREGLADKIFWSKMEYLAAPCLGVAWLLFTLQYTRQGKWLTRTRLILLAIVPVLTAVLAFTNEAHGLIWSRVWLDGDIRVNHGAWYWVFIGYTYFLAMGGMGVLARAIFRSPRPYRRQMTAIAIGVLAILGWSMVYLAGDNSAFPQQFTPLIVSFTGLAFACVPAFASSRADLNAALKNGGRTGSEGAHRRTRSLLVASEIALALVLLAGAGLLMRSFWRVLKIDLGYAPEHVLTAEVPDTGGPARNPNFLPELLARLKTAPGVQAAGAARALPLAFDLAPMQTFDIVGGPAPKPDEIREAVVGVATPGYFRAMQIALRGGRFFDERDGPQAPNVAVVNEAFVRRYFPKEDPIGRTLNVAPQLQAGDAVSILAGRSTIVGVVADVRQSDVLAVPKPQIWNPYGQRRWLTMTLAIRTAGDPKQLAGLLRSELRSVDKTVPLNNIRTAEEYFSGALAQRRLSMILLAVLAAVALVMSAVGAYGPSGSSQGADGRVADGPERHAGGRGEEQRARGALQAEARSGRHLHVQSRGRNG